MAFLVHTRRRTIYFTTLPSTALQTTAQISGVTQSTTSTRRPRIYSIISLVCATLGSLCVILLSGFDTMAFESPHRAFLFSFLVLYLLSAVFIVLEVRFVPTPCYLD